LPISPILPVNIPHQAQEVDEGHEIEVVIEEEFVCLEPATTAKVELWKLENTWFVTHGLNEE